MYDKPLDARQSTRTKRVELGQGRDFGKLLQAEDADDAEPQADKEQRAKDEQDCSARVGI